MISQAFSAMATPVRQAGYTARTASETVRALSMARGCFAQVGLLRSPARFASASVHVTVSAPPLFVVGRSGDFFINVNRIFDASPGALEPCASIASLLIANPPLMTFYSWLALPIGMPTARARIMALACWTFLNPPTPPWTAHSATRSMRHTFRWL